MAEIRKKMKVKEVIEELQKLNAEAEVSIAVGCYFSTPQEFLVLDDGSVMITDEPDEHR